MLQDSSKIANRFNNFFAIPIVAERNLQARNTSIVKEYFQSQIFDSNMVNGQYLFPIFSNMAVLAAGQGTPKDIN